jgi:hypothetical protein
VSKKRFITSARLTLEEKYSDAYRVIKSRDPRVPLFKFKNGEKK